jgi:hypothetical protein
MTEIQNKETGGKRQDAGMEEIILLLASCFQLRWKEFRNSDFGFNHAEVKPKNNIKILPNIAFSQPKTFTSLAKGKIFYFCKCF